MPEIEIRAAISSDLSALLKLDHSVETTHVWQLDIASELSQIEVRFREIKLPRAVRINYPRDPAELPDTWTHKSLFLVATAQGQPVAYLTIEIGQTQTARVTDLVVDEKYRRQGIASALIISCGDWVKQRNIRKIVLEMQAKNHAAIQLARKLGYEYCGFCDDYFANHDIAVFFIGQVK